MNKRPILFIPLTMVEIMAKGISVLILLLLFIYQFNSWKHFPAVIPSHFNGAGAVDGWGSKHSIWILPVISFVLFVTLSVIEKFPHIYNYPVLITKANAPLLYLEARRMLGILNLETTAFLGYISWGIAQAAYGRNVISVWTTLTFLVLIFSTIGISMYRMLRMR